MYTTAKIFIPIISCFNLTNIIICTEMEFPQIKYFPLQIEDKEFVATVSCILKYCETFFHINTQATIFIVKPSTSNQLSLQTEILTGLFHTYNHDVMLIDGRFSSKTVATRKAANYLVFIENISEMMNIEKILNLPDILDPLVPILIIITKSTNRPNLNIMVNVILHRLLTHNFHNVDVILLTSDGIEILTWFPYENENCGKIVENVKIISTCDGRNGLSHVSMDPFKIPVHNLHLCPINVAVRIWEPYVRRTNENTLNGIDIDLMEFVAASFKMVPKYFVMQKGNEKLNSVIERCVQKKRRYH